MTAAAFLVGGLFNGILNADLGTAVHESVAREHYGVAWGFFGAVTAACVGGGHLLGILGGDRPRQTTLLRGVWCAVVALGLLIAERCLRGASPHELRRDGGLDAAPPTTDSADPNMTLLEP